MLDFYSKMEEEQVKIVIIGHIDHGKSTLIGRLLYDTNSLPEDKMKEIRSVSQSLGRQTEFAYVNQMLSSLPEQQRLAAFEQLLQQAPFFEYWQTISDEGGKKKFIPPHLPIPEMKVREQWALLRDLLEQTRKNSFS